MAETEAIFDAVAADQEAQEQARELRLSQLAARRSKEEAQGGVSASLQQVQNIEQLAVKIRNIRAGLTIGGAVTAVTIVGIIWTLLQWNIQMIWTLFGLPGKDYIGLPIWLVPVVIVLDLLVFIAVIILIMIGYAQAHPIITFCTFFKASFGEYWYTSLVDFSCKTVVGPSL